jgi:hypothetical protein
MRIDSAVIGKGALSNEEQQILNIVDERLIYIREKMPTETEWRSRDFEYLRNLYDKFVAIGMILEHEHVGGLRSSRGVDYVYGTDGKVVEIKPSKKESAEILLYSGMDKYMEEIPTEKIYPVRGAKSRYEIAKEICP